MAVCDIVIASRDAKFGLSEVNWGAIPAPRAVSTDAASLRVPRTGGGNPAIPGFNGPMSGIIEHLCANPDHRPPEDAARHQPCPFEESPPALLFVGHVSVPLGLVTKLRLNPPTNAMRW